MMMSPTVSFPISLMNVAGTPNLPSEMSVLNVEPPRNGVRGLVVPENNVENSFSYAYDFTHVLVVYLF